MSQKSEQPPAAEEVPAHAHKHIDYSFLTKQTARSHTLHELCKALDASEAGVKNAMSRRKIEKCKDYVKKENGQWEHVPIGPEHHPKKKAKAEAKAEPEVDTIIGIAYPEAGRKEYLVRWAGFKDTELTWEKPEDLSTDVAKKAIGEFETEHGVTG
ncbi:unnamed protein product [Bathycoccus prasinos]